LKILAIAADDRRGFLHELQPHVIPLGELSPTVLLDAIRAARRRATSPRSGE
jgi:hypothetical protein